ncbi:putative GEM-like protein [Helianthus annuus]|nr:putative GEM-like protein [Helianthus annuus]
MIHKTLANNFSIKHKQIITIRGQNMDNRLSSSAMAAPIVSRGQLLSKSCQSLCTLSLSSRFNGIDTTDSLAVSIQNHVSLGPKLLEIVKHKLSYGAKILPLGREGKICWG